MNLEPFEELVKLENVVVRYRKRHAFFRHTYYEALKGVTFTIKRGETLGIIGRNGCGKSTLLRLLAGIYSPDSGAIHKDQNISISLLNLQAGFDPQLSGVDNALISLMLLGFSRVEARSRIEKIVEFSDLGEFVYQPMKTYSSGMQARLRFSAAINADPDLLLIDEVLSVGDAQFRKKAEGAMLKKLQSTQTIVFVSHGAEQMKRVCDRVIWIEDGCVRGEGKPKDIVDEYEAFLRADKKKMPNCSSVAF